MTKVNDKITYLTHTWILALYVYSEHSKPNSNSHKHNKMHHLHLYHLSFYFEGTPVLANATCCVRTDIYDRCNFASSK